MDAQGWKGDSQPQKSRVGLGRLSPGSESETCHRSSGEKQLQSPRLGKREAEIPQSSGSRRSHQGRGSPRWAPAMAGITGPTLTPMPSRDVPSMAPSSYLILVPAI